MTLAPRALTLALASLVAGPAAWSEAAVAGNCAGTQVGFVPLIDMGQSTYQGFEGGLYPGAANVRPDLHDVDADTFARVALLDPNGRPDAASGRIALLTVGMSNTSAESQAFIPLANAYPTKNPRVVLVNGAQGGWDAHRVADPAQNSTYWNTVDSRLAAAGVTPLQVQAVWLKEAEAGPTQAFPDDARVLQSDLAAIVRIIKSRYPNAQQLYLSSRIYAGYATTSLNPEPYAYQSGFAVRWLIQDQLECSPALNFDPSKGAVRAPWLSWGPYLWADGLNPRSNGLIWECADFQNDGTHPSSSGTAKVARMLLDFFQTDAVASRWYADCDTSDPAVFSAPPRVLGVGMGIEETAGFRLDWQSLDPVAGEGTVYDVVTGSLQTLQQTRDLSASVCAARSVADSPIADPVPDPPVGEGIYYLVRGRNGCGFGTFREPGALPGPREQLDLSSPCHN